MPTFWDQLKTNILSPLEKGVSSIGQTLGDIFKPVGGAVSDLFKPIGTLKPEQSEFAIKTEQGEYRPYTSIYAESAAQMIGLGARETDFWERLPHATLGAVKGFGVGVAKALTLGWWQPEVKYTHDAEKMAGELTEIEGEIMGTIGTFLIGGEIVQAVGRGIPAVAKFAQIAPKTYQLLTSGVTFAGLGQAHHDATLLDAQGRAKTFVADFALGGAYSLAGMNPNYFKGTGIIAPAAYVTSLIKGDTPEDALKTTAAVIGLHSINFALAKAFPSKAEQLRRNMDKAATEQLGVTRAQAREYLGVTEKMSPAEIKKAWHKKVIEITKSFPAYVEMTPQQNAKYTADYNTANRAYEFLAKVQNPTGYTGKTFRKEFEDLFYELWVKVPDKRALVVSAVRNMPAGLSIRSTLTPEQRAQIIEKLGGEEVKTKFGLTAGKLTNQDLITLAKEKKIEVTPSKITPEKAITKAPEPKVERKEIWSLPGDLMPARGKPTWKHSKMLWNTMRNQYGMTNTWSKDITVNKGAVSWIIDTLENGLASKKDLMTEARKTKGIRMDSRQYKKLYAMFKSRDYDIEGYKKVMSVLKGIKPAIIEKTIEPAKSAPKAPPIKLKTAEELIKEDRLRPQTSGFGQGKFWQYRAEDGIYTVAPNKEEAIKRANEALAAKPSKPATKPISKPEPEVQPTEGFQFDADSTAKAGKVTVKDPGIFEKGTLFRQKGKDAGVSYLMGKNTQTGNTEVQTIYFDKKLFTEGEAAKWWTKNGDKFTKPWSIKEEKLPAKPEPKPAAKPKETLAGRFYHGTSREAAQAIQKEGFVIESFEEGRGLGNAIYLSPKPEYARNYAIKGGISKEGEIMGVVLETKVKVDNVLRLKDAAARRKLADLAMKETGLPEDEALTKYVQDQGYDAILTQEDIIGTATPSLAIFDPSKIKVVGIAEPVMAGEKPTPLPKRDGKFTAQEKKAAKAEEIRLKYRPEEKELLEAERVPSVGEIMKSKKFQDRIKGKVKASSQMRLDEAKPAPPGSPPRPPKEVPIAQAPPPPEGSGLEAIDKMVGKVGAPQKIGEFLKGLTPKFRRNFTDRFALMKDFEEKVSKLQGQPIDINSSPYVAARLYAGRFGTIEAAFRDLQKIVTPVRKHRPDFTRYVLAQRAIERADRGFDNPAGVTKEQAELALTELKAKVGDKVYKQFEQGGQAIQNWSIRQILEPMRDTGLISKKAFNAIVEKNKNWMPFHVLDYLPDTKQADQMQSGSETFSVSKQGVIKGLKGTEKIIRDPFESIVDNLSKAISLTKRNEVARKLIDLRKTHPEAKESIKYLHKNAKAPKDWDTISAFINGKVTRWAVPKGLSDAMHSMSPVEAGLLGKLAKTSTKAFKAGVTTFYIPFTLTNAIRDYQTATVVNKWGFNPVTWLSGFKDSIKGAFRWDSKAYDEFLRNEGGYGGYIGSTRQLSIAAKELFTPSWWTKTKAVINPLNLISNFAEAIELSPRLGIYKKGIKKPGVTELEAAFEARNSTVDFAKSGKEMRIINQWIPFVNARWQGVLRVKDAFKEHPFKSAIKAMAMIVMPGVATYFYNILNYEELWDDIPQWAKDNYFIVILGSELDEEGKTVPKVLQIPKGDMGQIFFNPLQYTFEYVRKQEPQNLFKLALEWTSQISPIPFTRDGELSGSSFLAGALPPALKTLVEEVTNMNLFTGFPLIPRKLEKVAPTEQYNERTPGVAVGIGRAVGISPMRLAHVASGLFGSSSRYVYNPADLLGLSVKRFVRTQGGAKEREAWKVRDEAEIGYNTTRLFVQQALQAGDLQKAQSLATEWNNKVQQYIPQIVPYLMADDPKEAVSFQKSIMFDAADLRRLMKLNAPPGAALKPPSRAVGTPSRQADPLGIFGGQSPAGAPPTPTGTQPTMGQMFPTEGGGQNDPLGLFK